jgi:S-formylglutathione hydrolase FrmB
MLEGSAVPPHGRLRFTCVVLPDGGHNFAAWSTVMPRAFSWLSAQLVPQA